MQESSCWRIVPPATSLSQVCATPAGGQNGSGGTARFTLAPRNFYRLPKIWNLDLRVSRRFHFTESTALEVLIEGFNIFNRTQVTGANSGIYTASTTAGSLTVPASGVLTPTLANGVSSFLVTNAAGGTLFRERQVQFAVRFQF